LHRGRERLRQLLDHPPAVKGALRRVK